MFRKLFSNPTPKTNQESRTLESVDVSQHETKRASFNRLPDDLIKHLLPFTFLGAQDAMGVLSQVSKKTAASLKDRSDKGVYHRLEVHQKTTEVFQHLVRGEQEQVKAILEQAKQDNPDFLLYLLTTQFTITDHAARQFDKITLLQLAVWYLDRHMWEMLLEYLPKEETAIQLQEHESGKAAYVKEHGRHYNFEGPQGLVSALEHYVQLVVDKPLGEVNWDQAEQQWQSGVGGAQGQVPLHVIHEYCRKDVAFDPLTEKRFKEKTLPREVSFFNGLTKVHMTFWKGLRSGLGTSFCLYRSKAPDGEASGCGEAVGALVDSAAISRLCQVRKEEYGLLKKTFMPEPDLYQEALLSFLPKTNPEYRTGESVYISPRDFNSLPDDLIKHLLPFTFLGAKDTARVLPQVSKRTNVLLKDKSVYLWLEVHQVFRHLVRGEQNQVKAILEQAKKNDSKFLLYLLTTQFTITDHAKRQFDKITLFQLAVWYLDRHMWVMLGEYLPQEEAAIQLQEHESGKASYVQEHGRHYDFEGPQGLVSVLENYVQFVDKPIEINWRQVYPQWRSRVGKAQGQAPLHVIHEYCRKDVTFDPLTETRFKEETLPREVNLHDQNTAAFCDDPYTDVITFWKGLRSGLGSELVLYRWSDTFALLCSGMARRGVVYADSKAVSCLFHVRKEEYRLLKKALIPEQDSSQEESLSPSPKPGR